MVEQEGLCRRSIGDRYPTRPEDHSGMEMDISETGNIGTKGETRGTGMNGGVSEM